MMRISIVRSMALACVLVIAAALTAAADQSVRLDQLNLSNIEQDFGRPHANASVDGHSLKIGGRAFDHGVGTHAESVWGLHLNGQAKRFNAWVGVDSETATNGSVVFQVVLDGKTVYTSPRMTGGAAPQQVDVDLAGAHTMMLLVHDAGDGISYDHADWADATLTMADGAKPVLFDLAALETSEIHIAHGDPDEPQIHGPRIVGTTPGHPFIFLVPATGKGTLSVSVDNLPAGLHLDGSVIRGAVNDAGRYSVTLHVRNALGEAHRKLTIVAGQHQLALTPPMGWNSWNAWGGQVNAQHVREAADAMISSGLAAKGFQYVNIDDTWEGASRAADGQVTTNKKFGDMKKLADYVHGLGLKLGIYSSPGPTTCAGYIASYQHELQDARTYAAWGVDYLKYDWCSYGGIASREKGPQLQKLQKPYIVMRNALDQVDRDIVYSLCQYGMGDVWKWGGSMPVGGNCWRTTGDINDSWSSMSGIGFGQADHYRYAGPGHWNDPDMLVVGRVGWGHPHPTHLSPAEQVTHITLWSMLSAPLLIGCDMAHLDSFTTDLLTNPEVVDVDQDPLGHQAQRISKDGSLEVWAKPLFDGTVAVALFNRSYADAKVSVNWSDLDAVQSTGRPQLRGVQPIRDLWQRKDLPAGNGFSTNVPIHGAVLIRVGKPSEE